MQVRARFVERFSMGAPFAGGEVHGPAIRDMSDRVSWVEKFVAVGCQAQQQAQQRAAASAASQQVRVAGVSTAACALTSLHAVCMQAQLLRF
jgi:type II pantothenate kinase